MARKYKQIEHITGRTIHNLICAAACEEHGEHYTNYTMPGVCKHHDCLAVRCTRHIKQGNVLDLDHE